MPRSDKPRRATERVGYPQLIRRDPCGPFVAPSLDEQVREVTGVQPGMVLEGVVTMGTTLLKGSPSAELFSNSALAPTR